MLRRERVLERDIFRLGTGTVLTPSFFERVKYSLSSQNRKIGRLPLLQALLERLKSAPASIEELVLMLWWQLAPLDSTLRAKPLALRCADRVDWKIQDDGIADGSLKVHDITFHQEEIIVI